MTWRTCVGHVQSSERLSSLAKMPSTRRLFRALVLLSFFVAVAPQGADPGDGMTPSEAPYTKPAAQAAPASNADPIAGEVKPQPGGQRKRPQKKRRRSWLSVLGIGGNDKDGNPQPVKLPKLSTEEVLTGVFCIAIGGLFLSFSI